MNAMLEELLGTLGSQVDLYGALLVALDRENRAVINSELEPLNEVNCEKEMLLLKIQRLEEQRIDIMTRLSDFLGFKDQELSLEKLTQFTHEPYLAQLTSSRSHLLSLIKRLHEKNTHNMFLLTHVIDLVRGSMALLNNMANTDNVYHRTGKIQGATQNGRVVSGAI